MWRRKLHREYPIFFVYTVSHLVRFVVLYHAFQTGDREGYRQAFANLESIDAVLSFGVIYELFGHTFRAYEGIRQLGWLLFRWATVVLLVVAVVVAASAPGSDTDRFLSGLFTLERSVSVVRAGLLFLLFLFHAALGLRWARATMGIALGFGALSSIELVTFTLRSHFGMETTAALSLISSVAYDAAIVVWLAGLLWPSRAPARVERSPRWDIEGWNRTLLELMQR